MHFFINLRDLNIDFFMEYDDMDLSEIEIGIWLEDNHIAYRVVSWTDLPLLGGRRINELQFFEKEDVVAFKLRWGN